MANVGIINYGIGNVRSVENAVKFYGHKVGQITSPAELLKYDIVLLPGVGAFGKCVDKLEKYELYASLKQVSSKLQKLIGICVGHQLFFEESDESTSAKGLSFYPGKVQHLSSLPADDEQGKNLQLPNVGYRNICKLGEHTWLPSDLMDERYYFVHSYGVSVENDKHCVAFSTYAGRKISAISKKDNIVSFQFHPERSREAGLKLLHLAITN